MTATRCLCQSDIGHLCDAHRLELETGRAPERECCRGIAIHRRGIVHCCRQHWMKPYHLVGVTW